MLHLSSILADCSSSDLSRDSRLVAVTRGMTARVLQIKDLTPVCEYTFPEEVSQIRFSDDCLKFLVLNK